MDTTYRYKTNEYLNGMKQKVQPKENLKDCPLSELEEVRRKRRKHYVSV